MKLLNLFYFIPLFILLTGSQQKPGELIVKSTLTDKEIYWWTFNTEKVPDRSAISDWNIGSSSMIDRERIASFTGSTDYILDEIQQIKDSLYGNYEFVTGIYGNALKLDGFQSYAVRKPYKSIIEPGPFTVESWIAPAAYPWSWSPVVDCSHKERNGFFFGIDRKGHAGFKIAAGSSWYEITTVEPIPLREWTHIAAVFDPDKKISVLINGKEAASLEIKGNYIPTRNGRLTIGRNNYAQDWNDFVFAATGKQTYFYLDAILDEVKISAKAKTGAEILGEYNSVRRMPVPALSKRGEFPTGPAGSGSFGAFYTRLDYYKEWDDLWRVSENTDLYVRFDQSPVQFIFWRGTSFVPCWVTENNIWYTNEWLETWGRDVVGCAEPLMDRKCRFSHVRLIENTDARVVIHWRYALTDAFYDIAAEKSDGRGEWGDEYYILYPDMVGVRKMELHYSTPVRNHDWLEQIVLLPPGKHPDDVIEKEAVSLVNMSGATKKISWHDEDLNLEFDEPKGANMSLVNLKSMYHPFVIIPPDSVETIPGEKHVPFYRVISPKFLKGSRPDPVPSVYGWWDHWPVTQIPGDGRWVTVPDRPSAFSLGKFPWWKDYSITEKTRTRIMLHGVTHKKAEEMVPLARSWLNAPGMNILSENFKRGLYDQTERAYLIERAGNENMSPCEFTLEASVGSPVVNPAIVIKNWGNRLATLSINDKVVAKGKDFRQGIRKGSYGEDLIVWIRMEADEPVKLTLK